MKIKELKDHDVKYISINSDKCEFCDNEVFTVPTECYCNIDFDGCGYVYEAEYGLCSFCQQEAICDICMGTRELNTVSALVGYQLGHPPLKSKRVSLITRFLAKIWG